MHGSVARESEIENRVQRNSREAYDDACERIDGLVEQLKRPTSIWP